MKYLEYKGYTGSIEYSAEDNLLFGKILGLNGLISYEGETGQSLEKDFRIAINSYLEDCSNEQKVPEKPFKGSFNVRIPFTLHKKVALMAMEEKVSLNNYVTEAIRLRVANEPGEEYSSKKNK
jgi:predicted HicB family RNase H-like nuclease